MTAPDDHPSINAAAPETTTVGQQHLQTTINHGTSQHLPQAMCAFSPFIMQPVFAPNILQQQLNHNSTQMMIQNIFQSPSFQAEGSAYTLPPPSSEILDPQEVSINEQTPVGTGGTSSLPVTAIQNLMRLSTPQGLSMPQWNMSHFNMMQNAAIQGNSTQPQNTPTLTQVSDVSSMQQENSSTAPTHEQSQHIPDQNQPNITQHFNPASLHGNAPFAGSIPSSNPFQSLLKMGTNPVASSTGFWLAQQQYPQTIYGGMSVGQAPFVTPPHQVAMQNMFTQMATSGTAAMSQTIGVASPNSSLPITPTAAENMMVNRETLGSPSSHKGLPMPIYIEFDEETLTEYQCLLRKQIELFEAGPEDIKASAQGRNNPILTGQVGIRCRYCATLPLKCRPRGAVYYSKTIVSIHLVRRQERYDATQSLICTIFTRMVFIKSHKT